MKVLTFGEALICFSALTNDQDLYRRSVGGAEANTAIGLARLGHDVSWVSRVSTDEMGERVLRTLNTEGVNTAECVRVSDRPTGAMIKDSDAAGSASVTYYRSGSAASQLSVGDVSDDMIAAADVVHVTGVTAALGSGPLKTIRAAMRCAVDRGVSVSFDMNYRAKLIGRGEALAIYRELLPFVSHWMCNEEEAELLTGVSGASEACDQIAKMGPTSVIVKCGERGAVARVDGLEYSVAAYPVKNVVDSVGAGDAFNAGWLHGWALGWPIDLRLQRAAFVAAHVVQHLGDYEGFPAERDTMWEEAQNGPSNA